MKVKICITTEEKESKNGSQYLGYRISNMSDRIETIKLLRSIQGGNYWRDLAIDYVYEYNFVSKNLDIEDKHVNVLLRRADEVKWNKFVKVFADKGVMEIKTIDV